MHIFISIMSFSTPNPIVDHLLESSHRDDSNKLSNIGLGEEIKQGTGQQIRSKFESFQNAFLFLSETIPMSGHNIGFG